MTMQRYSRWGRSAYESDTTLATEADALRPMLEIRPFRTDAEFVATNSKTRIDDALLDQMPSAKIVVTTTSGYEHIDLSALGRRGVRAARLPLARRDPVVESTLAMMLDLLRRHPRMQRAATEDRWVRGALPGLGMQTIAEAPIGIIGLGVIGLRMAEVLHALGADLYGNDPAGLPDFVKPATVDEILQNCVAVTLHCRLTPETTFIINAERLSRVRPGLVLVNTARGGLVDVDAAVTALESGRLGGLGVDVFPQEPWPRLWQTLGRDDLLFTPHAAGYHDRLTEKIAEGLRDAATAYLAGGPVPWELQTR
ncbi:MAG: 2-hydroxyacid dehydrogenase [Myxococcota bacterium]